MDNYNVFEDKIKEQTIKLREKDLQYQKEKAVWEMQFGNLKTENEQNTSIVINLRRMNEEVDGSCQNQIDHNATMQKKFNHDMINNTVRHAEECAKIKEESDRRNEKYLKEIENLKEYNEKLFEQLENLRIKSQEENSKLMLETYELKSIKEKLEYNLRENEEKLDECEKLKISLEEKNVKLENYLKNSEENGNNLNHTLRESMTYQLKEMKMDFEQEVTRLKSEKKQAEETHAGFWDDVNDFQVSNEQVESQVDSSVAIEVLKEIISSYKAMFTEHSRLRNKNKYLESANKALKKKQNVLRKKNRLNMTNLNMTCYETDLNSVWNGK